MYIYNAIVSFLPYVSIHVIWHWNEEKKERRNTHLSPCTISYYGTIQRFLNTDRSVFLIHLHAPRLNFRHASAIVANVWNEIVQREPRSASISFEAFEPIEILVLPMVSCLPAVRPRALVSFERNERLYANFSVQQTLFIGNYITEMSLESTNLSTSRLILAQTSLSKGLSARPPTNVEDVWMSRKRTLLRIVSICIYDFWFLISCLSRIESLSLIG